MGQAKKRGTFEQRHAEAIERQAQEQARRQAELNEIKKQQRIHDEANPQQAAARRKRGLQTAMLMATVLSAAMLPIATPSNSGDL